ncbi:hypothetical protein AB0469_29395 [Streptomyces sp. NPDC093801]|uniref:hypothetical protein n=1 Tax=Streptomyces sp. NPDC093801 TaxID=3155203 RepID=UPI00344D9C51
MYRLKPHALLRAVLASSVVLGGVLAMPASAAPAASCTVTPDPAGHFVVITGEGFTAPRNLNDGQSTEPLNIDANGNFRVQRFQKNVDYTVLAVNEDQNFAFVNCKVVQPKSPPSTSTPQGMRQDYRRGYLDGVVSARQAAQQGCQGKPSPDKSQTRSDSYWNGWTAGATRAYDRICGTS